MVEYEEINTERKTELLKKADLDDAKFEEQWGNVLDKMLEMHYKGKSRGFIKRTFQSSLGKVNSELEKAFENNQDRIPERKQKMPYEIMAFLENESRLLKTSKKVDSEQYQQLPLTEKLMWAISLGERERTRKDAAYYWKKIELEIYGATALGLLVFGLIQAGAWGEIKARFFDQNQPEVKITYTVLDPKTPTPEIHLNPPKIDSEINIREIHTNTEKQADKPVVPIEKPFFVGNADLNQPLIINCDPINVNVGEVSNKVVLVTDGASTADALTTLKDTTNIPGGQAVYETNGKSYVAIIHSGIKKGVPWPGEPLKKLTAEDASLGKICIINGQPFRLVLAKTMSVIQFQEVARAYDQPMGIFKAKQTFFDEQKLGIGKEGKSLTIIVCDGMWSDFSANFMDRKILEFVPEEKLQDNQLGIQVQTTPLMTEIEAYDSAPETYKKTIGAGTYLRMSEWYTDEIKGASKQQINSLNSILDEIDVSRFYNGKKPEPIQCIAGDELAAWELEKQGVRATSLGLQAGQTPIDLIPIQYRNIPGGKREIIPETKIIAGQPKMWDLCPGCAVIFYGGKYAEFGHVMRVTEQHIEQGEVKYVVLEGANTNLDGKIDRIAVGSYEDIVALGGGNQFAVISPNWN